MFEDIKNFFKSKKADRKSGYNKPSLFIVIVCCLAIIIPSLFAIFYAYFYDNTEELADNMIDIQLFNGEDTLLFSESLVYSDISSSHLSNAIYGIVVNKEEIENIKKPTAEPNFKITLKAGNTSDSYMCYFSEDHNNSYIQNLNGTFFTVNERNYSDFLKSDHSETIYKNACPPALLTSDGEAVLPQTVEWNYKKQNGSFSAATQCKTGSASQTYHIGGAISVDFAQMPDHCVAELYDLNDDLLFKGKLSSLPFVTVETGEELRLRIDAEWENKAGCTFYGNATYDFYIVLVNKADFSINLTDALAGECIAISVKNADNASRIYYLPLETNSDKDFLSLSPALETSKTAIADLYSYKPIFVSDGDYYRALIPLPINLPDGAFGFSISYGASKQEFIINVSSRGASLKKAFSKSSTELADALSKESISLLNDILSSPHSPPQFMVFASENFASPADIGFTLGYGYRETLISSDNITEFDSIGIEYLSTVSGGQRVEALNTGVVVDIGESNYLGKYVVVEHGMGLRTWYCGLSRSDVREGDTVTKGSLIGKSGTTCPVISGDGILLLCTVYDITVDPNILLKPS